MNDVLRIVLDTGLFLMACTVIFVVGFILDARMQARRMARSLAGPAPPRREGRARRAGGREGDRPDPAPAA